MAQKVFTKTADPGIVEQIDIFSNVDNGATSVSIINGMTSMRYVESIMSDTIKMSITFVDSGNSINDKSVIEGLPLVGQEKVKIKFKDNNENLIGDKPELILYVNKITPVDSQTQKSIIIIDLVSKEYILNEKIRINKRYDGKISDHVKDIMSSKLKTEKKVNVEDSINEYNFFGNNKKSFYTISWLARKAVSAKSQSLGKSAGYFFYETADGFFFKSIDGLLEQKPKLKLIYNETPDINNQLPEGYDQKVLDLTKMVNVNVQEKLKMGTYSNRVVLFDPFTCYYEVKAPITSENGMEDSLKKGGKNLYLGGKYRNKEFDIPGTNEDYSRTQYYLLDKGTAPSGNSDQQISKSTDENFEYGQIANPSIMRYNQLYSMRASITIAGNFSLHAGDTIYMDSPGLETEKTGEVDYQDGGLYIITDICHQVTAKGTFTKCNLARDSFGRKPKASS